MSNDYQLIAGSGVNKVIVFKINGYIYTPENKKELFFENKNFVNSYTFYNMGLNSLKKEEYIISSKNIRLGSKHNVPKNIRDAFFKTDFQYNGAIILETIGHTDLEGKIYYTYLMIHYFQNVNNSTGCWGIVGESVTEDNYTTFKEANFIFEIINKYIELFKINPKAYIKLITLPKSARKEIK